MVGDLTLRAGHAGGVAAAPLGAVEVSAVMQAVGQRHLCAGAAHAAHHHGVRAHLARPVPRLLNAEQKQSREVSTERRFPAAATRGRSETRTSLVTPRFWCFSPFGDPKVSIKSKIKSFTVNKGQICVSKLFKEEISLFLCAAAEFAEGY